MNTFWQFILLPFILLILTFFGFGMKKYVERFGELVAEDFYKNKIKKENEE